MLITFSEDLNVSFYHNFSVEVHYMQFYFITFLLLTSVTQRSCDTTIWWLINQYRQGNKLKHSVWTFTLWALTSPLLKTNFLSLLLTRQRIVLLAEGSRGGVPKSCQPCVSRVLFATWYSGAKNNLCRTDLFLRFGINCKVR